MDEIHTLTPPDGVLFVYSYYSTLGYRQNQVGTYISWKDNSIMNYDDPDRIRFNISRGSILLATLKTVQKVEEFVREAGEKSYYYDNRHVIVTLS
jgi:hypothetical protein